MGFGLEGSNFSWSSRRLGGFKLENEYLNFLLTRRSIRKFKPDPISREVILKILDVARYAPSARNAQPWIFIVITDEKVKNELASVHSWTSPLKNAPLGIVIACNKDLSPHSYQVDCANVTMYVMLAAHALGLGSVWLQTLRNVSEIQKILNLPENYVPVSMLAIGYPDEKPTPRPRKNLNEITFKDRFNEPFI